MSAFHHAFADTTATLAALQLPERRADVLRAGAAGLADTLARLVDAPRPSSFTSAMLGMIAILFCVMFVRGRSADAALELAADRAARLIATALRRDAVVPNFLAQMASELAIAAARDFVAHLFSRNLVELPSRTRRRRALPPPTTTHRLVEDGRFLRLERLCFLCD